MVNSRNIDDLSPEAAAVCRDHIAVCHSKGIELIVTSTYRDYESQNALYAIGRTVFPYGPRTKTVTNAKAGESWHNFRCAWDVVPIIGGKPIWESSNPVWKLVIEYGEARGAVSGSRWIKFPDRPHFQKVPKLANGSYISLAEAKNRFDTTGQTTIFV